jgi:hypothetical protein
MAGYLGREKISAIVEMAAGFSGTSAESPAAIGQKGNLRTFPKGAARAQIPSQDTPDAIFVMPSLVPGIHALVGPGSGRFDLVDGRVKPGHDGRVTLVFVSEH